MPRGRKKKTAIEVAEPSQATMGVAQENQTESADHAAAPVQEPPFEPTGNYAPTAEEVEAANNEGRGRFRSWASDSRHGYSKLTDNERQRIILQFDDKPSEDVITAIKGAGFQFQPEYHGLKQVWTRRNDFEGRLQVEAIETLLRESDAKTPER